MSHACQGVCSVQAPVERPVYDGCIEARVLCRYRRTSDKKYPFILCANSSVIQDTLIPTSYYDSQISSEDTYCTAQRSGCGEYGKPCCIAQYTGGPRADVQYLCNKGATCPQPWNDSSVCEGSTSN